MDKEALMEMLKNKFGDSIDLSLITDEDLATLVTDSSSIPEPDVDSTGTDESIPPENAEGVEGDDGFEDIENINIDDIDESQLDDNGKLLVRIIKDREKKYLQEKLRTMVSESGVDDNSKSMLNEMIKLGASEETLKAQISNVKERMNKTSRQGLLGSKTFGRTQFKAKTQSTQKQIKIGSKEFGASLLKK